MLEKYRLSGGSPKARILHIDGDDYIRKIIRQILPPDSCIIDSAENGKQALLFLEGNQYAYDLVITEMHLKFASGHEIINAINRKAGVAIPVIVISNLTYFHIEKKIGIIQENYFKKPFVIGNLVNRIKLLVQSSQKGSIKPIVKESPAKKGVQIANYNETGINHPTVKERLAEQGTLLTDYKGTYTNYFTVKERLAEQGALITSYSGTEQVDLLEEPVGYHGAQKLEAASEKWW